MAQPKQSSGRIHDAAESIRELRRQRREDLPSDERAVESFMHGFGRPRTIAFLIAFVVLWIVLSLLFRGTPNAFDQSPFPLLNLVAQLTSLTLVIAILSAQNTQSEIDQERSRLMLQMAIVQDRKLSEILKILGAHEEERTPTDVQKASKALKDADKREAEKKSKP